MNITDDILPGWLKQRLDTINSAPYTEHKFS